MQTDLEKFLPKFDVISFDVFDTLLFRSYLLQEDLWTEIDQKIDAKGKFLKARIKADKKTYAAATRHGGEHTLSEAYRLMPTKFATLEPEEEKLQRSCLRVNEEMLAVWKRAGELGKRRIIVSDMYLSEAWFAEILRDKGYGDYDTLYVSSACQARKSSGMLFNIVRKDFPTEKILHIGDNAYSDVEMAKIHGLEAWHYPNFRESLFSECPFLQSFIGEYPSHSKRLLTGELSLAWHQFVVKMPNISYWHRLGFFFGGLLGYIYVTWLARNAKETGIEHLLFVARDGYLWKQMFDRMNTGIRTDYFYAPRLLSVKVCGVIGSDPWALEDRRKILANLPPFDAESERKRYSKYLSQFDIGECTAIVDGISSAFSVQSLVEKTVAHVVPTFYLMALAPMRNGKALFSHPTPGLNWQQMAEYLFSSPERPIEDVNTHGPIYCEHVAKQEKYRERFFASIAEGALEGFDAIRRAQLIQFFSTDERQLWLDFIEAFQTNMSAEDKKNLSMAQNATNVRQDNFRPVQCPVSVRKRVTRRFGIPLGCWRGHSTPDCYIEVFYVLNHFPIWRRVRRM